MGVWSWLRSLRHDCLGGQGQVEVEIGVVLVKPCVSWRVRVARELARLEVPEVAGAVPDPDLPDAGPLFGQAGAIGTPSSMGLVGVWALPATASVRAPGG